MRKMSCFSLPSVVVGAPGSCQECPWLVQQTIRLSVRTLPTMLVPALSVAGRDGCVHHRAHFESQRNPHCPIHTGQRLRLSAHAPRGVPCTCDHYCIFASIPHAARGSSHVAIDILPGTVVNVVWHVIESTADKRMTEETRSGSRRTSFFDGMGIPRPSRARLTRQAG